MKKETELLILNMDYWGLVILAYIFFIPAIAWNFIGQSYIALPLLIGSIFLFCLSLYVATKGNKLKRLL